jgi:hypothetical protein
MGVAGDDEGGDGAALGDDEGATSSINALAITSSILMGGG